VRHFRTSCGSRACLDREFWSNWVERGAGTMHQRCVAEKERILREHEPVPLDADTAREVDRIVASARRNLGSG